MSDVSSELKNGVRTITMNRPHRLNAIGGDLTVALRDALLAAAAEPAAHAIVLRGAGRAFCAGDDLKEFSDLPRDEAGGRAHIDRIQDVTRAILGSKKTVIAAVHGWAAGGGLEWMIDCDLVIMADTARCFFPEVALGLFVTGGVTALLPRIVGPQRARAMILFGEKLDAAEALALGLAWKVVPEAALFDEAQATGERIASLPARSVRALKRVMGAAPDMAMEAVLDLEAEATFASFQDPESRARVEEFGG
jgi:enoyl-CoA hydratase/carnithine racemase